MNKEIVGWEKCGQHRYDRHGRQRSWKRKDSSFAPKKPKQMTIDDVPAKGDFIPVLEELLTHFDEPVDGG